MPNPSQYKEAPAYDGTRFRRQNRHYYQVVDTDYEHFVNFYECQDIYNFILKETGKPIRPEEAWNYVKNKDLKWDSESTDLLKYEYDTDKLDLVELRMERIHILVRGWYNQNTKQVEWSPNNYDAGAL